MLHVAKSLQSYLTLHEPINCSLPGSSVHGIIWQEYWSGLPFPPPGDLPDSGIKPASPLSAGGFFTTSATWETHRCQVRLCDTSRVGAIPIVAAKSSRNIASDVSLI